MPDSAPEIAVVDANAMSALGMATLLSEIMPRAVVRTFNSFIALTDDTPDAYFHYFVSAQIFLEHTPFFLERKRKLIVLTSGLSLPMQYSGVTTLNICQAQKDVVADLTGMYKRAHKGGRVFATSEAKVAPVAEILTQREIEVLVEVVRGLTNKEISEKLSVSVPTIVSHRLRITEKLGIKTLSGLAVFAIANGIVDPSDV